MLSDEEFKACVVPMTTTTGKVIVSDGFGGRSRSDHNSRGLLPINRCLHRGGTKWASPPAPFYRQSISQLLSDNSPNVVIVNPSAN